MDLRVSQAEPGGLHMELMGLQVSVIGQDTMGATTEPTVKAVTALGQCINGQGPWVAGVAGGVIVPVREQSAMLCSLSRYTQYSNMELGYGWERRKEEK